MHSMLLLSHPPAPMTGEEGRSTYYFVRCATKKAEKNKSVVLNLHLVA